MGLHRGDIVKKLIFSILAISILIFAAFLLVHPMRDVSYISHKSDKAEGVQSLVVSFTHDYDGFNYTRALENLTKNGYNATLYTGNNNSWEWCMMVEWPIPDKEYAKKYVSSLNVTFYGYAPSNDTARSHVIVGFGTPIMVDTPEKKEEDKELGREAAEDIGKIIGISLDWETHIYTVAWMTMTSEGYCEEK